MFEDEDQGQSEVANATPQQPSQPVEDIFSETDSAPVTSPEIGRGVDDVATPQTRSGRVFRIVIIFILVLLLIALGVWVYAAFFSASRVANIETVEQVTEQVQQPVVTAPVETKQVDTSGDTDFDGLSDLEEQELGTSLVNSDSDRDGLSDFEEVRVWKTNPLNPDTDADTFRDGDEVKGGYDPLGPGRITDVNNIE